MTTETFNSVWIIYYDASECAYDVMPGSEWLKRDREHWQTQRMPTRVMLDLAETEGEANERLKDFSRRRRSETVGVQ